MKETNAWCQQFWHFSFHGPEASAQPQRGSNSLLLPATHVPARDAQGPALAPAAAPQSGMLHAPLHYKRIQNNSFIYFNATHSYPF